MLIVEVVNGLHTFVRTRRESLGMTQKVLAERAGVSQAAVSDVERGATKLPNADLRRRLAAALHVQHIDLLIAAGELAPDEVDRMPDPEPGDPVARLSPFIYSVAWDEMMYATVRAMVREWAKMQRENAEVDETIRLSSPQVP